MSFVKGTKHKKESRGDLLAPMTFAPTLSVGPPKFGGMITIAFRERTGRIVPL